MRKISVNICIIFSFLLSFLSSATYASPGDTIVVQTFTFGSPQDAWFVFPADSMRFEKIQMQYTLKCNSAQNPACGEWDYLTYTYLYDHTGKTDSSVVHQPVYLVNGNTRDSLYYSNSPTFQHNTSWQYSIVHDNTVSLNTYTSGTDTEIFAIPFGATNPVSRSQFLWKASELAASGMGAGNITGMQFYILTQGNNLKGLSIRVKATTLDSLTESTFQSDGFTEVYKHTTQFASSGWNSLQFTTPFIWDGISNLIIEITYDNATSGIDNTIAASQISYNCGLYRAGSDRSAGFHDGAYISVPLNDSLQSIDSAITVSFWAYGTPEFQPQDGTCFEAIDSAGNRIFNVHLPWSNNNIYWDAGNSGSTYDRINKAAVAAEIEGKWNYWAFTKNTASGSMKIYLNGNLWHSGTGKVYPMGKMDKFTIGKGNWSGSKSYEGNMDEFAVFGAELDQTTIQSYMNKTIDASHPYYSKLFNYYHFDDGNYQSAEDATTLGNSDAQLVSVDNALKHSSDYVYGFTQTSLRPNVVFEQGVYSSHLDSVLVLDSIATIPLQIVTYTDSLNNPGVAVDTFMVWPAGFYNYMYDATGTITDSMLVNSDSLLQLSYYNYYNYFPQVIRYELARYITPYGNSLSLGNGWTWTFDVSDYRTLLADSVHLAAGNWQELLDMRFLMIEGTPSRDVISVQNLWNGGFNYGQTSDPIENHLTPKQVIIPEEALNARWKSRITGHGMDTPQNCAEFCAKSHYFKVNGTQQFSRLVWRDNCDLNPLYPQGGTWVYDRANWCPGAEVWTYDFELTPFINGGDTIILDHDAQPYTSTGGWDYYQIEDQLVTYGAPNFTLDAAIEKVLSPSTDKMWARVNPICSKPKLILKNNGSTDLTSLTITYGINGAQQSVYNWTGLLHFLDTTIVTLDSFAWAQGASAFTINLSNPNGGTDQYTYNNTVTTPFTYVPVMPSQFVIELKTNKSPNENSYELKDDAGNVIISKSGLSADTYYRDTVSLSVGCYEFRLKDTGEDGLTWWANTAQGSGSLRFKYASVNQIIRSFSSDFGGEIYLQFTVGLTSNTTDYVFTDKPELKIYPNPASDECTIDFDLPERLDGTVDIIDIYGKTIRRFPFEQSVAGSFSISLLDIAKGFYFISLRTGKYNVTKKLVVN